MQNLSEHPPLHDRAYEMLRQAILKGEFAPGERLFETDLAARLGISRSPVREAIRRLQQDGLLDVKPRLGIFVATIDVAEIDAFYRMRSALEGASASLAAERATGEELDGLAALLDQGEAAVAVGDHAEVVRIADGFHKVIHSAARSQRLFNLLTQIYGQVTHFRNVTLRMPGRAEDAFRGHEVLLEYLRARDAAGAEEAMRAHVNDARLALLRRIENQVMEEAEAAWD